VCSECGYRPVYNVAAQLCRPCYMKRWYEQNKERRLEYQREYYVEHQPQIQEYRQAYNPTYRAKVRASKDIPPPNRDYAIEAGRRYRQTKGGKEVRKGIQATRRARQGSSTVNRQALYEHDKGMCGICHRPVSKYKFEVDHIVPIARGGKHLEGNVQVAHPTCNRRKGDDARCAHPISLGL
jgi:5-methylcytosine-specific restriction endonuclease McrA